MKPCMRLGGRSAHTTNNVPVPILVTKGFFDGLQQPGIGASGDLWAKPRLFVNFDHVAVLERFGAVDLLAGEACMTPEPGVFHPVRQIPVYFSGEVHDG